MIPKYQVYINPKGFAGKLTKEVSGEYILQGLNHTKQVFGTNGKLTTISEVCGTNPDTINVAYNGNGNPVSATDSLSGRAITLTWDANQKLSSINDPMSNTWSFTQNGSNQLTTITQPVDNSQTPPPTRPSTTFSYDGNNLITGHDDFLSDSYEIGYGASSPYKVTSWTDPASNVTGFSYAAATTPYDKKTTVTDAESIAVDYYFGATSKQLEKIEQTVSATTLKIEMGYNATTGFQTTSKDSYGNTTTMAYDSVGHLTSKTLPPAQSGQPSYVKTFTYSTPVSIDSNVTQVQETVTAQQNSTTSIAYTDANNPCLPTSITDPLNQVTTKSYNSSGQITSLVQPTTGGTKTTGFSYSLSTKDLSIITDALSNDTQYLRNMNGQVAEIKKYDGSTLTGTLKVDETIAIGQLGYSLATSDSVSGLTQAITKDDNGATLTSTSKLGCTSSVSLKDLTQATMPNNVDYRAPSGAIGSIITPTIPAPTYPVVPYNPSPSSSTNSKNQTSSYTYFNNGKTNTMVNHLSQTTTISYDLFGRTDVVSDPFGKTTTYGYNLNSQTTSKSVSGVGTTTYVYDDARRLTQLTEPVKGTNIRSMNLRGNLYADTYSSYSRDILGRLLSKTNIAGGTETYSYSPEGYKTNDNGIMYSYDAIGNVTSKNGTAFTYTGASGSTSLGLPSSSTNQSYTYGGNHFLSSLTDTSKSPSLPFQYSYSGSKELLYLNNSNQTQLQQVFVNKSITQQTYVNTQNMTQFSQINQGFNANDQLVSHQYSIATGTTPFTETISMTYNALNKLNTTTYSSNNKVLTYFYGQTGKLSALNVSGLGVYEYNYNQDGTISSVTYPNQTQDVYTYNGPKGRLSQIQYPNGDTVSLNWNGNMQVGELIYTSNLTQDVYSFLYDGKDRTTRFILTQNGIQSFLWDFTYDALGIKTATKIINS